MKKIRKLYLFIIVLFCLFAIPYFYSKYVSSFGKNISINVSQPAYSVVFHGNNNSNTTFTQLFIYGTGQRLRANTFSKPQYVFTGWNTEIDGSGTSYIDEQLVNNLSQINNDTVHLYAQWRRELTFTVTGNPSNWTNQDVTLTVVPDVAGVYEYSFDGGSTWQSSPSQVFSSNQSVNIKIRELDGFTSNQSTVNITKIDKNDPTLNSKTLIVTLNESVLVNSLFNYSDSESGISNQGLKVYRYDISNNTRTDEITNTNYFTYPGLYAIEAEVFDVAGNSTVLNTQILVRWPTGGRYVVKKTELDGDDIAGTGHSSSTSVDGLYKDNADTGANSALPFASKYYYAGANVDNYISFAGSTFWILNISTNDDLKILGDISDVKTAWGDRKIYLSNTYNTWSTKWWPRGQIYNHETGETKYKVFSEEEQAHLALATFYAGRFTKNNASNIAYTVYYEQTNGVNLGGDDNPAFEGYSAYPNVSDYLKACKAHDIVTNIYDSQSTALFGILGKNKRQIFKENSWIDMTVDQWTLNSKNATSTDNDFWVVDTAGGTNIQSRTYYYNQQYRVVFYINDATILSGDGSSTNPYTVQEDWTWFDDVQVLQ